MIGLLALRNLAHRPWRSVLLFLGFGLGVAVMIVLLGIGEAMLAQARDERLVGGGQVTVLPDGIDVEVMKTGGVGGLFFSIANARFVHRQLLAAPRLAHHVRAAAPQIEGKLLYLRAPNGKEYAVRATGELPSVTRAVGGMPPLGAGQWEDDDADRRWRAPTAAELRHDIDHFHHTPVGVSNREGWAEWHYFNVLTNDRRRWAFLSFILAGDVPAGRWGGQVLLTMNGDREKTRRFVTDLPPNEIRFSTTDANLTFGGNRVTVLPDGRYEVKAAAREEGGSARATVDLVLTPTPHIYFPGTTIGSESFVSGYVVPALRGEASGTICIETACERFDAAQGYHDHNWGVWSGVQWEWGSARAGSYTLLYGHVLAPDTVATTTPLFLLLVDSLGFRALFRPRSISYVDSLTILVDGRPVRVPSRAVLADVRGTDTLRVELEIEHAIGSDTRRTTPERGEGYGADWRGLRQPYFIQMKGTARLTGRVGGQLVQGAGAGFFETYR